MSNAQQQQSSKSDELQYIYSTLRKLRYIQRAESNQTKQAGQLDTSLFPQKFLLKLLEERLADLDELANEACTNLFKQIGGKPRLCNVHSEQLSTNTSANLSAGKNVRYPELDEYFHYSLYYLHDFLIGFDWHEPDIEILSNKSSADYVFTKLKYLKNFLSFQKILNNLIRKSKRVDSKSANLTSSGWFVKTVKTVPSVPLSNEPQSRALKSSLSITGADSPRVDSPNARRRVRFKDQLTDEDDNRRLQEINEKDLQDNHSIFAFNLLIYALNLFIQQLSNKLVDWSASIDLGDSLKSLLESKQKLRVNQLQAVARKIKVANDVYLTVLDYLTEIKNIYLIKNVVGTLIARDSERLFNLYKSPRVIIYIHKIGYDVESKILFRLADQCLQMFLDLIVSEINLPPIELESETKTRSKDEIVKSQENLFNFITSWLNVDDILFDFSRPKNRYQKDTENGSNNVAKHHNQPTLLGSKVSTLNLGSQFKSSSRILAQMDNLSELMSESLAVILNRLRYQHHLKYFLELVYAGLDKSFDMISTKLSSQLAETRSKERLDNTAPMQQVNELELIESSIDLIAAKIRCLKFIHIMSSADKIIADASIRAKIGLSNRSLEAKLDDFTEFCTRQTSSSYTS